MPAQNPEKQPMPSQGKATPYHHGDLRQALLDAAEAELAEKGLEGFTLRGCAKRAGVSHAAPAHHFRDANGLLTALAAVGHERFTAAMQKRQAVATSPRGRLIGAGLGYLDFARANPGLFRLMFASLRPDFSDPGLAEAGFRSFSVLTDAVRDLTGVGPFKDRTAMLDAMAAWSVVHGLAHLLLAGQLPIAKESDPDATYAEIIGRAMPGSNQLKG
jgi:AcrR family transcriptional regulator